MSAADSQRPRLAEARDDALAIYEDATAACSAASATRRFLAGAAGPELARRANAARRLAIVGVGKAASGMVAAICEWTPRPPDLCVQVIPERAPCEAGPDATTYRGGHPLPDAESLRAGGDLARLADQAGARDLWIVALTGGASALLELPVEPLVLNDLLVAHELLLESGAPIGEVNAVRARLSALKAGGLARRLAPGRACVLVASDVVGNDLAAIGSGPFVPSARGSRALQVVRRRGIADRLPPGVLRALSERESAPSGPAAYHAIVVDPRDAMAAARDAARRRGWKVRVLGARLEGEAANAGRLMARAVGAEGRCLLAVGETVVARAAGAPVGRGGRAQELALAAAIAWSGGASSCLLAAGTDGRDGPTDAAGALIDAATVARGREAGLDPVESLRRHDSYSFLDAAGDRMPSRWTGTNVLDLVVALGER